MLHSMMVALTVLPLRSPSDCASTTLAVQRPEHQPQPAFASVVQTTQASLRATKALWLATAVLETAAESFCTCLGTVWSVGGEESTGGLQALR